MLSFVVLCLHGHIRPLKSHLLGVLDCEHIYWYPQRSKPFTRPIGLQQQYLAMEGGICHAFMHTYKLDGFWICGHWVNTWYLQTPFHLPLYISVPPRSLRSLPSSPLCLPVLPAPLAFFSIFTHAPVLHLCSILCSIVLHFMLCVLYFMLLEFHFMLRVLHFMLHVFYYAPFIACIWAWKYKIVPLKWYLVAPPLPSPFPPPSKY